MEILKFENAGTPRKTKKSNNLKSLAGLATVAAIAVLGSTLAANISLGSASGIEFGQGVQVTAACDNSITVTPSVTFANATGTSAVFYLSTVALSGIDASSTTKCQNTTFQLNAYGDTSATPLQISTGTGPTAITDATFSIQSSGAVVVSNGLYVGSSTGLGSNQSITLGFSQPSATSGAVYKLTLQSR